jgi:simple sugar transport system ATP-binding protein
MYEGEMVGEFDPNTTNENELGLYMAGSKRRAL